MRKKKKEIRTKYIAETINLISKFIIINYIINIYYKKSNITQLKILKTLTHLMKTNSGGNRNKSTSTHGNESFTSEMIQCSNELMLVNL